MIERHIARICTLTNELPGPPTDFPYHSVDIRVFRVIDGKVRSHAITISIEIWRTTGPTNLNKLINAMYNDLGEDLEED